MDHWRPLADHYIRQVGKNCIMAKMYQAFYDPEDCMFKVRILVDRSTVETFVGDGEVVFTIIFILQRTAEEWRSNQGSRYQAIFMQDI